MCAREGKKEKHRYRCSEIEKEREIVTTEILREGGRERGRERERERGGE